MEPKTIIETINSLLKVMEKVLEKIPNYDQKKKDAFFDLKKKYIEEKMREDHDHAYLMYLQAMIINFATIYLKEINGIKD
jgi:hypothetical protein